MTLSAHTTTDADHGRIKELRHSVCHNTQWLFSDRRYPDEPHFTHLAMIAMVENHVEREGRKSSERRYYLSSVKLVAQAFAAAVRAPWGLYNVLKWVLHVVFPYALTRIRPRSQQHNNTESHNK